MWPRLEPVTSDFRCLWGDHMEKLPPFLWYCEREMRNNGEQFVYHAVSERYSMWVHPPYGLRSSWAFTVECLDENGWETTGVFSSSVDLEKGQGYPTAESAITACENYYQRHLAR